MLGGTVVRYDLGDDRRLVGTLCPDMTWTLERPDPDVVTAVTRSAALLREGCGLLLDLVDRAEVRDAAGWTGRVNTVTARTDRVDVDASLIQPDGCVAWALPIGQDSTPPAGACAGHLDRPTGLSAALTVVSDSLGMKQASDERCNPHVGG
ncbi:hypothetical protein [Micromonospora sp. NPDC048898]|uniref:aromatic-ring hydroxylase C-terminal domain-containing protein n=1 Tax=Micromonospora sp. NPDC048898 TaxID=3364260 RepID=UPI003722ABCD